MSTAESSSPIRNFELSFSWDFNFASIDDLKFTGNESDSEIMRMIIEKQNPSTTPSPVIA